MSESLKERTNNSTVLPSRGLPSAKDQVSCQGNAPKMMYKEPKIVSPTGKNSSRCVMKHLADLEVELANKNLWKVFHAEEHEMKISNDGRALFPVLSLKLSGLLPFEKYSLTLNFVNVDSAKYRYTPITNRWLQWSSASPDEVANMGRRLYEHPSSPATGAYWSSMEVTFDKLRVTNNFNKSEKHMIQVSSLRKYRIQVIVTKLQCSHCHQPHVRMVELPLTEFLAVTGYRNDKITQLKIEYNPSSAAFREEYKAARDSRKRKQELHNTKHAFKIMKKEEVSPKPVPAHNFSWDEPTRTSCCKQSSDTLTKSASSIDLDHHVSTFLKNDVIHYSEFYQSPYSCQAALNQFPVDISPFHIPEISTQYPRLNLPGCQERDGFDFDDQSFCYKYDDFASPVLYTEWDTLYY